MGEVVRPAERPGAASRLKIIGGKWSNWSGGVTCEPREVVVPADEAELAGAVRKSSGPVRAPGSGHSFTRLNETDGTLIDLSNFTGLKGFDRGRQVATLGAATPLWQIGPLIHPLGVALKNMGDIDRQTLGGVVGTGTHGTGWQLGSFSAEVAGFRLLLASGEIIHSSRDENTEIFEAGRTSFGIFGLMTEITMNVRPAFKLVEASFLLPLPELFSRLDELVHTNKHFEFFCFPYADSAICKTLNETNDAAPGPRGAEEMRVRGEKVGADSRTFEWINRILPYAPFLLEPSHRLFSQLMPAAPRVRWSHEIFPSPRPIRFNEMEYAVPFEKGPDTVREIIKTIRSGRINTGFPLEYRTVAADDVWMSPFYKRPSATIAVHQYRTVDTSRLFDACEAVFRAVDGRPHWGKRHNRSAAELAQIYPQYQAFRKLRDRLDPGGKFLNAYLRSMFG